MKFLIFLCGVSACLFGALLVIQWIQFNKTHEIVVVRKPTDTVDVLHGFGMEAMPPDTLPHPNGKVDINYYYSRKNWIITITPHLKHRGKLNGPLYDHDDVNEREQ